MNSEFPNANDTNAIENISAGEELLSLLTARALGQISDEDFDSLIAQFDSEEITQQMESNQQLGDFIRSAIERDLPAADAKLRERILATFEEAKPVQLSQAKQPVRRRSSAMWWMAGIAATICLSAFVAHQFNSHPNWLSVALQSESPVALKSDAHDFVNKHTDTIQGVENASTPGMNFEPDADYLYTEWNDKALDLSIKVLKLDPSTQKAAMEATEQTEMMMESEMMMEIPPASKEVTDMMSTVKGREGKPVPFFEEAREKNSGEQYESITENAFVQPVGAQALSTFSIDVDTASYANVRRFLNSRTLPPATAVRIEELINYFSYDYPQPKDNRPFSVDMEIASCPWNPGNRLLRVGLKGKEIDRRERPDSNIVLLLDVSGSMSSEDKLPLLKSALLMMVDQLSERDRLSIVTYASGTAVRLQPTAGSEKETLRQAISQLKASGSTNGSAGIQLAYELALQNFQEEGTNRVILATDGDLNVGITDDQALVNLITEKAASNIFLTVLGFGTGNLKDAKMEKLADHGNGLYAYIDSMREARKVLVQQMSGNLVTIAKDVKLQLEFNPAEVAAYRLIGYENRSLAAQDFDNDKKDAGEIGAGHTVTALYEIVPTRVKGARSPAIPELRYQQTEVKSEAKKQELSDASQSGELLTLALRYKMPEASESEKFELTVKDGGKTFDEASDDFRFAASVAAFGMLLRNSEHCGAATFSGVEQVATSSLGEDQGGFRSEFIDLVRIAGQLK